MAEKTKRISVDVETKHYQHAQREHINTGVRPKNYFEEAIRKHFKAIRDGKLKQ